MTRRGWALLLVVAGLGTHDAAALVVRASHGRPALVMSGAVVDSRRGFLGATAAAAVLGQPSSVGAFCGDQYPAWAYFIPIDEGPLPYPAGGDKCSIFLRGLGDVKKEQKAKVRPVLLIPGGPGLAQDYLETVEAVCSTDRRVLLFDPLGSGMSSPLPESGFEQFCCPQAVAEQASFVVAGSKLAGSKHHVFAHGTGAAAALLYCAGRNDVASLTLASPVLGAPPAPPAADVGGRVAESFPWSRDPSLQSAIQPGRDKPSLCLAEAYKSGSSVVYRNWRPATPSALMDAADQCPKVRTLLTSGKRDLPAVLGSLDQARALLGQCTTSSVVELHFADSGHMAHLDEREAYVDQLVDFYGEVDGTTFRPISGI